MQGWWERRVISHSTSADLPELGFRFWGLGFRVQGLGCRRLLPCKRLNAPQAAEPGVGQTQFTIGFLGDKSKSGRFVIHVFERHLLPGSTDLGTASDRVLRGLRVTPNPEPQTRKGAHEEYPCRTSCFTFVPGRAASLHPNRQPLNAKDVKAPEQLTRRSEQRQRSAPRQEQPRP